MVRLGGGLALLAGFSAHCAVLAQEAPAQGAGSQAGPAKPEVTAVVERSDLEVVVEGEGSLDVSRREKIKLTFKEYPGPLVVAEVATHGQRIAKHAMLLRLDVEPLERMLRGAREDQEASQTRAAAAREELGNLQATQRLKLVRAMLERGQAARDLEGFKQYGEEKLLKGKALAVRAQEARLNDQQDELEQLEKIYRESKLAAETKEIVLERARRDVALGAQGLELSRKDEKWTREFEHPQKKEQVQAAADHKKLEAELAEAAFRLAELAKREDVKKAERAARETEERVARLESDLKHLLWRAPFDGVVLSRGLEAGDKANPHAVLAELLDPSNFEVHFTLRAGELEGLACGEKVLVQLLDRPDLELEGKVREISSVTGAEGADRGSARFGIRASLNSNPELLPGLQARVRVPRGKRKGALSVPRAAVQDKDGRTFCQVRVGEKTERREVVLGLGNRERVQVLKGLAERETVLLKE